MFIEEKCWCSRAVQENGLQVIILEVSTWVQLLTRVELLMSALSIAS